ncbi:hypothetical protein DM860_012533 [Cuscuta australis]|uniref:YGGT family protein n=1 Tax=Cuscuta australis TaxID=267555 RepID=A0A328DC30_9ASTE|nr:hypothetical protein DM860_012533 [Cuscuta australis]
MASRTSILQTILPPVHYPRRDLSPIFLPVARTHNLLRRRIPALAARASISPPLRVSNSAPILFEDPPSDSPLTGSTRAIATVLAVAVAVSKAIACRFGLHLRSFQPWGAPACSAAHLFFAAAKSSVDTSSLNTPLTVIAAGMAKWLDIYSGVLMVRVLLSWFPNIPWERQPLSAIRDLCDPYLNLFRNIIPPIFDTLDVSPLLAFAVLGTLGGILTSAK